MDIKKKLDILKEIGFDEKDDPFEEVMMGIKNWYLEHPVTKKKILIENPGQTRKLRRWAKTSSIIVSNRYLCEDCDTENDAKEYIDAYGNTIHLCEGCMNEVKDLADYKEVEHEPD